jgi:hypothetical protein
MKEERRSKKRKERGRKEGVRIANTSNTVEFQALKSCAFVGLTRKEE